MDQPRRKVKRTERTLCTVKREEGREKKFAPETGHASRHTGRRYVHGEEFERVQERGKARAPEHAVLTVVLS